MTRKSLIYASFSLHSLCGRKGCNVVDRKLKASHWVLMALMACVAMFSQPKLAEAKSTPREPKAQTAKKAKSTKVAKATPRKQASERSSSQSRKRKVTASRASASRAVAARSSVKSRTASVARVQPARVTRAENVPAFSRIAVSSPNALSRPTASLVAASGAKGASFGQLYGLHQTQDPLELKSSVALVMDQDTNEVMLSKNPEAVLPIASLTKLMTAVVVVEAHLPLDDAITITSDDVDTEKNSSSRLAVGSTLSRGELLHLALMSSENRAAHALGRTYPGGLTAFVSAMNAKARLLGMHDTRYVDPTGLNSGNQATARDLATLVKAAYQQPLIRELSVSPEHAVRLGNRQLQFRNTNSLVRSPSWDIGLQKTGYIVEAGRCLVMQASMAGRKFIMVFLDSAGKYSRQADAERVRRWLENAAQKGALTTHASAKVTS
jgi:serine-type D-Ala-D-Ala endopeptidase (penicillin-binding protein 7)